MSQRDDAQVFEFRPRDGKAPYVHGSAAWDEDVDEPVHAAPVDEPVPRQRAGRPRRRLVYRVRPTRQLTDTELVDRDRARARRADAVERVSRFTVRHGARAGRGAWIVGRATAQAPWRWVWQPKREAHIDAMDDANAAATKYEQLTRSRMQRGAVLIAATGTGMLARPLLGPAVMDVLTGPWWTYPVGAGLGVAACWAFGGRRDVEHEGQDDGPELPRGLYEGQSDRSVEESTREAFAHMRVHGRVLSARRAPGGWGWIISAEIISDFGAKELDALARLLDTPRGGLLVSMPRQSTRMRVFRVVAVDLLDANRPATRITIDSLSQPVALAPKFDGDELELSLAGVHVLVIGRTGSGKSTALWRLVDAYAAGGAKLGGIDLSDGPDLRACRAVFDPALSAFGDNVAAAMTVLEKYKAIALDRKRRLPDGQGWQATEDDPHLRLVIDEYGLVAEHPLLLELCNWLIKYGRNVGVFLVLANQRFLGASMGNDTTVWSQVQVKILMAQDGNDAKQLPKSTRELGVAPELFVPANDRDANDAGKAYVVGLHDTPPLVRFGIYGGGEILRRCREYAAAGLAQFGPADTAVLAALEVQAAQLPRLVSLTRDAIVDASDKRDPARASTAEIVEYLQRKAGFAVSVATLTGQLRKELGEAYPDDRRQDTNLPGGNFKGWHLDDLDRGIARYHELH